MTDYTRGMHRYEVHKYPYVEVRYPDKPTIHARVEGWNGDMIMIAAPTKLLDRYSWDQLQIEWVHKTQARRIRSKDSIWASIEDNTSWHELEDSRITYRPDPWLILGQEKRGG
ncbi:hypothetical protein ACT3R5_15920 [Glutamicibacter sp. AOP5-A2-7]